MATLRELLVGVSFKLNQGSVANVNSAIDNTKSKMSSIGDTASSAFGRAGNAAGILGGAIGNVINGFNSLGGAVAGAFAGMHFAEKAEELAEYNNLMGTLKINEQERREYADDIYKMSQRTASSYQANKELTADIASNMYLMGGDSEKARENAIALVGAFRQAGMLGTQATGSLNAAVLQLKQAVAKGVLQGDELRSLKATAPKLIEGITKAYGFATEKALQDFASKGNLTLESLVEHLPQIQAFVNNETANWTATPKQAMGQIENVFDSMFDHIMRNQNVLAELGKPLVALFQFLQENQPWLEAFFSQTIADALPIIQTVTGAIMGAAKAMFEFAKANPWIAETILLIGGVIASLITFLTPILAIGKVLWGVFSPILELLPAIFEAFAALEVPLWPVIAVIMAIVGAIMLIKDNWGAIMEYVEPGLQRLQAGVEALKQAWINLQPFIRAVMPIIEAIVELLGVVLVGALMVLWSAFTAAFNAAASIIQWVTDKLNILDGILSTIGNTLGGLADKAARFIGLKGDIQATKASMDGGGGSTDNSDNSVNNSNNTNTTNNFYGGGGGSAPAALPGFGYGGD